MPQPAPYTAWKITCGSPEEAQQLECWLSGRIDLNRTMIDTVRTAPAGIEHVQAVPHRLGDYFVAIRVSREPGANAGSFRLRFELRSDAGRFWRDLMVNLLQEIEAAPQSPSVVLDSKGEPHTAPSAG